MGRRVLRRVLRRGSKKGLSRRHLEGRNTPFREYDPLGERPRVLFSETVLSKHYSARFLELKKGSPGPRDPGVKRLTESKKVCTMEIKVAFRWHAKGGITKGGIAYNFFFFFIFLRNSAPSLRGFAGHFGRKTHRSAQRCAKPHKQFTKTRHFAQTHATPPFIIQKGTPVN